MNWRKSIRSSHNGNCVETAADGQHVLVRDTANRQGAVVPFPAATWRHFIAQVKETGN